MTNREIAELAAWTAKSLQDTVRAGGRALDNAGADIIREYVQTSLTKWQNGEKITEGNLATLLSKIFDRRRHETKTEDEVLNAMRILCSKFPAFVENNQRQRDAEAQRIAATMPAVKV